MKASVKMFTSDGTTSGMYPIKLIITHRGKTVRKQIGLTDPNDWDINNNLPLPTHPDYDNLYVRIVNSKAKSNTGKFRKMNDVSEGMSFIDHEHESLEDRIDFYKFYQQRIDYYKSINKDGTAHIYTYVLKDLQKFKPRLYLDQVTIRLVDDFKEYKKLSGASNSGIQTYLACFRSVYNKCCRANEIINKRPFEECSKDIPVKSRRKKNVYLSRDTIKILEGIEEESEYHQRAIDISLLQFYLGGLYVIDVYKLRKDQLYRGRAFIKRIKLAEKGEEFDVKIFPKAKKIIEKYSCDDPIYVFPWMNEEMLYRSFYDIHKNKLREIFTKYNLETLPKNEQVVTRSPRHTFATLGKFSGVDVDIIRELMGHERNDMDTVYKDKFPQSVKDKAHWRIIDTSSK